MYKTIILPVVLYGCETWSLTLREEHRLRMFGSKGDKVAGEWRSCAVNIFIICAYPQISLGRSSQGEGGRCGMCSAWERREDCTKYLMGKPEGKRPLGRLRHRWEDGIRIEPREIGYRGVKWFQLAQNRDWWQDLVNMLMNLQILVPQSYLYLYTTCCFKYLLSVTQV
jgi:hypothetical protein